MQPLEGVVQPAAGERLDDQVRALITGATGSEPSRTTIRRLVLAGVVRLNGRVVRQPARAVRSGDRLSVAADVDRLPQPHRPVQLTDADVLYEDEWLVALDKPAGIPTHATLDRSRPDLHRAAQALLLARGAPPPDAADRLYDADRPDDADRDPPYLGIHHRLDRDTSGVVLFTKDRSVNAGVGALFAGRRIEKTYLAVVTVDRSLIAAGSSSVAVGRAPAGNWTVRNHLGRVGRSGKTARYGSVRAGGDLAVTEFRTRERIGRDQWLIEATPKTGRTHQVRVHLSESGLPIVGDDLYGGHRAARTLLHARRLAFPHPTTGQRVEIESPVPLDMGGGAHAAGGDGK
jgi:23S rRNA pseudouridine1911/1915/1917 synthase